MLLVQGILLALLAREPPGAAEVYTSLLDGMLATQIQEATFLLNTGRMLNWGYLPLGIRSQPGWPYCRRRRVPPRTPGGYVSCARDRGPVDAAAFRHR